MGVSGLISMTIGFCAGLNPAWIAVLCIAYTIFSWGITFFSLGLALSIGEDDGMDRRSLDRPFYRVWI